MERAEPSQPARSTATHRGQLTVGVCPSCGETAGMGLVEHTLPRAVLGVPLGRRTTGWTMECGECGDQREVDADQAVGWARGLELQRRYARSDTMRRRT